MNRSQQKRLIKGFLDFINYGGGIDMVDDEEGLNYLLDEYLGVEDDVLAALDAEMAVFAAESERELSASDFTPRTFPTPRQTLSFEYDREKK